jgi:hypothetical protein
MAQSRRIVWLNVITVISAAILIGAEVFGAAFAGSWALATLFDLGGMGQRILDALFVLCGIAIMARSSSAMLIASSLSRRATDASSTPKEKVKKVFVWRTNSACTTRKNVISVVPNFARACGRVSVSR